MKKFFTSISFLFVLFLFLTPAHSEETSKVTVSTTPVGSPFFRFLADDFNIDIKELVKFEKKGFSRTEIVTLVLISESDIKKLKEIGNRRIKDLVPMETLCKEANLEYRKIIKVAHDMKIDIENRSEKDLPPAVFETPTASPSPTPKPKKKDEKIK